MNNPIRPLSHPLYRIWVPATFALFLAFTVWVIVQAESNFFVWFLSLLSAPESLQVVLDLSLALLLLWQFIYWEHRARGGSRLSMVPFFLATFMIGVIAPLAFLGARSFWPKMFLETETTAGACPASLASGGTD